MDGELTHAEIVELLGVYALDAVDDDERAVIEAHLPTCPRCAAEVAEHLEVAAQMANSGAAAPEGVWAKILDSLEEPPPPLEVPRRHLATSASDRPVAHAANTSGSSVTSLDQRRSLRQWLPLSAAAAVLVVVGLLGGVLIADRGESTDAGSEQITLQEVARRALNDPDSVRLQLAATGEDGVEATAVVTPDGAGYLLGTSLPPLDESQTYQLWGVRENAVISLGILGRAPNVVAFHLDDTIDALAITSEVAGGVEKSSNAPVVVAKLA